VSVERLVGQPITRLCVRAVLQYGSTVCEDEFQDFVRSPTAVSNRRLVVGCRGGDRRLNWTSMSSGPVANWDTQAWSGGVLFLSCRDQQFDKAGADG
jgi:hypothetical protein